MTESLFTCLFFVFISEFVRSHDAMHVTHFILTRTYSLMVMPRLLYFSTGWLDFIQGVHLCTLGDFTRIPG